MTKNNKAMIGSILIIDDNEIIYRDPYQIVISWETYERHKDKHEHQEISEIDKDLIICTFDGITDDEIEIEAD